MEAVARASNTGWDTTLSFLWATLVKELRWRLALELGPFLPNRSLQVAQHSWYLNHRHQHHASRSSCICIPPTCP